MRILLGITGSVAAIKTLELAKALKMVGDVTVVLTTGSQFFVTEEVQRELARAGIPVHIDQDQWPENYEIGDDILHIKLRQDHSCLVIAPLDANTMAKMANGICDNLLTDVYRAWDWVKPVIVAPAMNTHMWEKTITEKHLAYIEDEGGCVVEPVNKKLACGDIGVGAMADIKDIVSAVESELKWQFPLKECNGVPINHHPGAFGFHRKNNHHTGVDLYTKDRAAVFAVENGVVVKNEVFTGPKLGHTWWEETSGVMIEGVSGVVNYGEITSSHKVGDRIFKGGVVGNVKRVLFENKFRPDIPGHSTSMLHLELYKNGAREFADWHYAAKNPELLDPTPHLLSAVGCPKLTLTWDNAEGKTVG